MTQNLLKPARLSFWRLREKIELATRNTYMTAVTNRWRSFAYFAPTTILFAVTLLLSLATSFRNDGISGLCLASGLLDLFIFLEIIRQFVILTPQRVVSGDIFWKWFFGGAIALEYNLIDSVKLKRNFGRPCLEISSSGAEVTIKLVAGWRIERLVPILKILEKHGVRWAFDDQCQRLVERPILPER